MDPRELTDAEAVIFKEVTGWWKANRAWLMRADILRRDSPDPAVIAEQQQAEDDTRFVVFAGKADTSPRIAPRPLRLTRLEPTARCRVALLDRAEASPLSRGTTALKDGPIDGSGSICDPALVLSRRHMGNRGNAP